MASEVRKWVQLLPDLITGPELASEDYVIKQDALVGAIQASGDSILQILQPLEHYLTTESDTPRTRALAVLAKVTSPGGLIILACCILP